MPVGQKSTIRAKKFATDFNCWIYHFFFAVLPKVEILSPPPPEILYTQLALQPTKLCLVSQLDSIRNVFLQSVMWIRIILRRRSRKGILYPPPPSYHFCGEGGGLQKYFSRTLPILIRILILGRIIRVRIQPLIGIWRSKIPIEGRRRCSGNTKKKNYNKKYKKSFSKTLCFLHDFRRILLPGGHKYTDSNPHQPNPLNPLAPFLIQSDWNNFRFDVVGVLFVSMELKIKFMIKMLDNNACMLFKFNYAWPSIELKV